MSKILKCPLCGYSSGSFLPFGLKPRANARCPQCGAVERHRFIGWYLFNFPMLREGMRILDVAPTPALIRAIDSRLKLSRVKIDLYSNIADVKMNLVNVGFGNEVFDAVFCVHVLEHVYDDLKALDELYRVLRVGGWAMLMVPIDDEQEITDDGRDVPDPGEREHRFGQSDHLRAYGNDFVKRCEAAGFRMDVITPEDEIINRHAVLPRENIYLGWRE